MASDQEWSFCWFLVYEEVLSKISTTDVFFNALKIWIERPQVLNRRLLGSHIIQSFLTTKCGDLLAQIFSLTRSEPITKEKLLSLMTSFEEEIDDQDRSVGCLVDVKIRSLLPRESNKYCNVLEMVVQGSMRGLLNSPVDRLKNFPSVISSVYGILLNFLNVSPAV